MPHTSPCSLLALPNELIIEILSHCPFETIPKIEKTCKSLRRLCEARAIWLALMQRLEVSQAPNLLPHQYPASFPTTALKAKVEDAVRRSRHWCNPERKMSDMQVRELPLPHLQDDTIVRTRLLPGGTELLLVNRGQVELWSVRSQECLWTVLAPEGRTNSISFDFEVIEEGAGIILAVACEEIGDIPTTALQVHYFAFGQRTHKLVFERRLPPVSPSRMLLQGDFLISCIPCRFQTVVINWKTEEALKINFVDSMGLRMDARSKCLAGNNLIFFSHQKAGFRAIKLSLSSLKDYWSTEIDHAAWTNVPFCSFELETTVLPLPVPTTDEQERSLNETNPGLGLCILAHHVFTPTWRENAPIEIFIVGYSCGSTLQTPLCLVSFRLQLVASNRNLQSSLDSECTLSLISSSSAPVTRLPRNPRSISNAGLMFFLHQNLQCFSLFSEIAQPVKELHLSPYVPEHNDEFEPIVSSIDPWSGTIAVGMPRLIRVLYID